MEDFQTSPELDKFNEAFRKFQSLGLHIKKDAENPHFRSSFSSLPNVLETALPRLLENGFIIMQFPLGGTEVLRLLTRITHAPSSQFMSWVYSVPLQKKDSQGSGSAITYSRRYNITSPLGLPEVDDDGEAASHPPPKQQNKPQSAPKPIVAVYEGLPEQKTELIKHADYYGISKTDKPSLTAIHNKAMGKPMKDLRALVENAINNPL